VKIGRVLFVGLLGLVSAVAAAHTGGTTYLEVDSRDRSALQLQFDFALADLDEHLTLDVDGDGELRWSEIQAAQALIEQDLTRRVKLQTKIGDCQVRGEATLALVDREAGRHLRMVRGYRCANNATVTLNLAPWLDDDPFHGVYVSWRDTPGRLVLLTGQTQTVELTAASVDTFARFFRLGAEHLVTGYDHLAFLALLLLGALLKLREPPTLRTTLWPAVKIVTAFTLAHSVTLGFAAIGWLQLPAAAVEVAIAASIALAAFGVVSGRSHWLGWPVAAGFGLIHGLGFANMLADLLTGAQLLLPLLAFNLGIEVAQLVLVLIFYPVLCYLARWPSVRRAWGPAVAAAVGLLACYWMIERWP
jgi:hypothetical protein